MQIRIIIEHKYSSSYQKQIGSYREERKEGVFVSIFTDQERNTKISTTHPRLRVIGRINTGGKGIKKKLNKKRRGEGQLSLEKK
jgi:hypothetical protein